jgi:hypothetical protein
MVDGEGVNKIATILFDPKGWVSYQRRQADSRVGSTDPGAVGVGAAPLAWWMAGVYLCPEAIRMGIRPAFMKGDAE